jgi:hypothetical protein
MTNVHCWWAKSKLLRCAKEREASQSKEDMISSQLFVTRRNGVKEDRRGDVFHKLHLKVVERYDTLSK